MAHHGGVVYKLLFGNQCCSTHYPRCLQVFYHSYEVSVRTLLHTTESFCSTHIHFFKQQTLSSTGQTSLKKFYSDLSDITEPNQTNNSTINLITNITMKQLLAEQ